MRVRFKNIPTFNFQTKEWSKTTFESQEKFTEFLWSVFKEPGEYELDECTTVWNEASRFFDKRKYYTSAPKGTKEYKQYWDDHKEKARKGVIYKNGEKTWFVPGDYYMLLNFLPVPSNKEQNFEDKFCVVRDVQLHMALYDHLAAAEHKHATILKRRQCMSSNYHAAKFVTIYWFEKDKRLKMLGYDESYLTGPQGTWSILESYRDFLNTHTAWYRPSTPNEIGSWQQKEKRKIVGGKWVTKGLKSSIIAKTLNKDFKSGIGGPTAIAFYEESGVAPHADKTLQFLNPAMESGTELVGQMIFAGSVGELKDCKPLEKFIKNPNSYRMLAVPTRWFNESGKIEYCGLFIPSQYGMPQAVDEWGNSQVEKALEILKKDDEFKKANVTTYEYNVWKSQNPTTIEEAFQYRDDLFFPVDMIGRRQQVIRLEEKEGKIKSKKGIVELSREGNPKFIPLSELKNPPRELEHPIDPKDTDKRGVVTIYEDPEKNAPLDLYFAGVDTIEQDSTESSNSVFSIDIVKRGVKVVHTDRDGKVTERYEPPKLVANYRGRMSSVEDTNQVGILLLRLYNARAAVERNKPNFINQARREGYEKYIMKRKELPIFKDVDSSGLERDDWGIYIGSDGEAEKVLNNSLLDFITRKLDVIFKKDKDGNYTTEIVKTVRFLDTINDYWLLEELKRWYKGLNTDRRVSYGLAVIAASAYEMSYVKTVREREEPEEKVYKPRPPRMLIGGINRRPGRARLLI